MRLEILILTQNSRHVFLDQLLSLLYPQIVSRDAAIHVGYDDRTPGHTLGEKREYIRQQSTGDYICWIDDDDLVPPYYVSEILPRLDGVDIIGWEQEIYQDHSKMRERDIHRTLNVTPGWHDTPGVFHRDYSHLQPIRRELALLEPMEGGPGEDDRWAKRMRERAAVKTEHFIDRQPLYYYLWRTNKRDDIDAFDPWRLAFIERLRP